MLTSRICKACRASFAGGPRAWYCPACRHERRKAESQYRRKHGPQRPLGSVDHCVVCGGEYTVNGGRQKYCPKCAPEAVKEIDRRQGLEYYGKNKDAINPVRILSRRKTDIACSECGKPFDANGKRGEICSPECRRTRKNRLWRERYYRIKQGDP